MFNRIRNNLSNQHQETTTINKLCKIRLEDKEKTRMKT